MGSKARLDRTGVMMIENGQVTVVALGSTSSLVNIESPEEAGYADYQLSCMSHTASRTTCLVNTLLWDESFRRAKRAIL